MKLQLLILILFLGNVLSAPSPPETDENPTEDVSTDTAVENDPEPSSSGRTADIYHELCTRLGLACASYRPGKGKKEVKTKYELEVFNQDVLQNNSLKKHWEDILNLVNQCKLFTTKIVLDDFSEFRRLEKAIYDEFLTVSLIKMEFPETYKRNFVSYYSNMNEFLNSGIESLSADYNEFAELLRVASTSMENRAKYIENTLVNKINYKLRMVANSVLATIKQVVDDTSDLRNVVLNEDELNQRRQNCNQQFRATHEDLTLIVKLLRQLIRDNGVCRLKTAEEAKKIYSDYNDEELNRRLESSKGLEGQMIKRELERREINGHEDKNGENQDGDGDGEDQHQDQDPRSQDVPVPPLDSTYSS